MTQRITKRQFEPVAMLIAGVLFLSPGVSIAAEVWKPYVCKVFDIFECQQGRKQIFPVAIRYSDKDTCYREFKRLLETDQKLGSQYPQTDDPAESYIFGCVKE